MVPSIAQQLQALRNTMAETIIPALPADAGFAQEQAGLMVATLDWLADVQAHAYRYEVAENTDLRAALADLEARAGDEAAAVRERLDAPAPPALDALPPLADLAAENQELKELVGRLLARDEEEVRTRVLELARRQGEREAAWFRMTGFPKEPGDLRVLLQ